MNEPSAPAPTLEDAAVIDLDGLAGVIDALVDDGFEVIRYGRTKDPRDTGMVEACAGAGATWWVEYIYTWDSSLEATRARIHQGPPRP